jgi:hypothetical protein
MIVRPDGDSWLLITQPEHAALSAHLMRAWQAEGFPERPTREVALLATAQHDIGWEDADAAPLVDPATSGPYDFVGAPTSVKQAVWRRALAVLPQQSTYVAALVAQHALHIYRRYRDQPDWQPFLEEVARERDRWFWTDEWPVGRPDGHLDPPVAERRWFLQDYATLRTGDILSLAFCNGWTHAEAEGYTVHQDDGVLLVTPDPFGGLEVRFSVAARRVARAACTSAEGLRAALASATTLTLTGCAVGVARPPEP